MKLDTLKKTWQQGSSKYLQKSLSKDEIRAALNKKTHTITDKVERNVRIAFFVVLGYIVLDTIISFVLSSNFTFEIPNWILITGYVIEITIIVAFSLFVYQFYKVKKRCKENIKLKDKLLQNINMLKLYKKIYYSVSFLFIGAIGVAYITGMYNGIVMAFENDSTQVGDLTTQMLLKPMGIGILIGLFISFLVFLLIRWIFRRLFGQYLKQLQLTLQELNEVEH